MLNRPIRLTPDEITEVKARRDGRKIRPEKQIEEDLRRRRAEDAKADLERKYKALLEAHDESEGRFAKVIGLADSAREVQARAITVKASGKHSEATAVIVASDWHLEERVDPDTIEGLNEYNPSIAKSRVEKLFQNGLSLIDMARTRSKIDTCILALIGDLITGYIHAELMEGNYLSPTESLLSAISLASGGIDFLLKEGKFKNLIIPCNFGNHGRTTEKPRVGTAAKNSYEWLGYQFLKQKYEGDDRITFQIANGYFNYVQVYDTTVRFHHGDGIKYMGGVGDVDVPLNKAIAQWNKAKPANLDVLGHWHCRKSSRNFVINGSAIGFNAYSIKIKASYEPPCQSFFLLSPERGKTLEAPIFLS